MVILLCICPYNINLKLTDTIIENTKHAKYIIILSKITKVLNRINILKLRKPKR